MKNFKLRILKIFFLCLLLVSCRSIKKEVVAKETQPNVIFISIDDLRPDLGAYGNKIVSTPNIDRLANEGSTFMNHFAQVPTSGASRYSMLTGKLPSKRLDLSNHAAVEQISNVPKSEDPETFIDHLRRNGYYTVGIGKISHSADGYVYGYEEEVSDKKELPQSWDELTFNSGKWGTGWNAFFGYANGKNRQSMNKQVKPYERGEVDDFGYVDGLTAQLAVEKLNDLAKQDQPFFLGVGFFKPHLPFTSPAEYWDRYDKDEIETTKSPNIPIDVNTASLNNSSEFNQYLAGAEKASLADPISEEYSKELKQAYFAAISYVDAQVGKILDSIDELKLSENTIVVLWGDHGWQLGDHRVWGKHTLFEKALKSAFIIKVPGYTQDQKIEKIVSSIDIYPTLAELCHLEHPYSLDGNSLVNLLQDQQSENWNNASFGYYNNGITLRTERYRLTRYFRKAQPDIELYDHKYDPNENENIAADNPVIVKELMKLWEKGDTGIYRTQ